MGLARFFASLPSPAKGGVALMQRVLSRGGRATPIYARTLSNFKPENSSNTNEEDTAPPTALHYDDPKFKRIKKLVSRPFVVSLSYPDSV